MPKGEFGGDALQRVASPGGQPCGTILWESKRTKNCSDGWLAKLREDQRTAKAEVAVLVSQALPRASRPSTWWMRVHGRFMDQELFSPCMFPG